MRLFQSLLRASDGTRVLGQISVYPTQSAVLRAPTRRLILPKRAASPIGKDLATPAGEWFLVADEMVDYGADQRSYLLIKLTDTTPWVRKTSTIDPVTDLKTAATPTPLGNVRVHKRQLGLDEDLIKIPEARFEIVTSAALQLDDLVGPHVVLSVEQRLGVYFAQVR